jgi:hypothetical protein
MPVFVKPFYVGHLYKNRTFVMEENPELEEGTTYYSTSFEGIFITIASTIKQKLP